METHSPIQHIGERTKSIAGRKNKQHQDFLVIAVSGSGSQAAFSI